MKFKSVKKASDIVLDGCVVSLDQVEGSIKAVNVKDAKGNRLRVRIDSYNMSVEVPAPPETVTKYRLHGQVIGINVDKIFDEEHEAEDEKKRLLREAAERWKRPKTRARILLGDEPAWLLRHPRREYVRLAILATPPWVTAAQLRAVTSKVFPDEVIDHVVPLAHPYVCGLNVPWNLQRFPKAANAKKLNAFHPDQILLDIPEFVRERQLRLPI